MPRWHYDPIIENTSWKVRTYGIYARVVHVSELLVEGVRSGAASCNKRLEFWHETHTPLWLLNGRIIFLTREKTSFAILIGRIIFFMCENHRSLLRLARTNLRAKIYDIAFWWVFLSMYSWTPLFRSPKGNGKKFEIAGFRNNRGSVKLVTMNHFLIKYSTVWRKTLIK